MKDKPFWPQILAFLQHDKDTGLEPCRTLFVGSSSIRYWAGLDNDMPRRKVVRRGFGGAHLAHLIYYFEQLVERHQPSEIVVYAGENDISGGRSPAEILMDLKALLKRKSQSLGATPVYFISIKPSIHRWSEFEVQARANDLVAELAETRDDLVFVNVVPAMVENGQPKRIFQPDGLHMTREGYTYWAQVVNYALDNSGVPSAPYCQ
ncbi:MAG: GDSL-type esterase/lipase family protein [Hyphomicrobiaceae bacterium]